MACLAFTCTAVGKIEVIALGESGDTIRCNVLCNGDRCKADKGRDEGPHSEWKSIIRPRLVLTKEDPASMTGRMFDKTEKKEDEE